MGCCFMMVNDPFIVRSDSKTFWFFGTPYRPPFIPQISTFQVNMDISWPDNLMCDISFDKPRNSHFIHHVLFIDFRWVYVSQRSLFLPIGFWAYFYHLLRGGGEWPEFSPLISLRTLRWCDNDDNGYWRIGQPPLLQATRFFNSA